MNKTSFHITRLIILLLLTTAVAVISGSAQTATATLDSTALRIGQQTKLHLAVSYRVDNGKQTSIQWPKLNDTITEKIDVVSVSKLDTIIDKNDPYLFKLSQDIVVTSFDSGYWAIPPFYFIPNNDSSRAFSTDPLLLQVSTVQVDTTQAIKPIKTIYEESYTWLDWIKDNMYVVWGSLAALLSIVLIIIIVRRMRKIKPPMIVIEKPKIPAHIIAFTKLEKLQSEKLWQEGKLKNYYSALSDITREYIENRFNISALEQTTEEILYGFRRVAIDEKSLGKLKQLLSLADLVKFAKEQPLPNENEQSLLNAREFVEGTKKEETIANQPN